MTTQTDKYSRRCMCGGLRWYRMRFSQGTTDFIDSLNQYLLNAYSSLRPGVKATNKVLERILKNLEDFCTHTTNWEDLQRTNRQITR